MGFTTLVFYKSYGEGLVADDAFERWNTVASDKLSFLCGRKITEKDIDVYGTQIQKATVVLIDTMFKLDQAEKNANSPTNGNIKSMTSGGQSVSFGNNETVYSMALSSVQEQNRLLRNKAYEYLYETDLFYEGA